MSAKYNKHRFVVYRQEKIEPDPIVLVTAETAERIKTDEDLIREIKDGVKKWVTSGGGTDTYNYAGDDMNIGDLHSHVEEFLPYCIGIVSLSFEYLTKAPNWTYDTSLCDEIENSTGAPEKE